MNTTPSQPHDWLMLLAQHSLGDIEIIPDFDLRLSQAALRAQQDAHLRDDLLRQLAFKVARYCSRYRSRNLDPWTYDDVIQEAYLAWVEVLDDWVPLESSDGPAGFGYYFLRVFPLRLASRVRTMLRHTSIEQTDETAALDGTDPLDVENDVIIDRVMAEICGHLNSLDQQIFRLTVDDDLSVSHIAKVIEIDRRTIQRHWPKIISIARRHLREAG